MYEVGKVGGAPIVAGSEASEMLEATKASLDPVAVLGYDAITKVLAEMSCPMMSTSLNRSGYAKSSAPIPMASVWS